MTTTTPLSLIRAHLNLEQGDDRDEELLAHYAASAEAWVATYIGQPFTGSPLETQAVLMLVAHSYETREAVTFANAFSVGFGVHDLLSPLKARVTGRTEVAA